MVTIYCSLAHYSHVSTWNYSPYKYNAMVYHNEVDLLLEVICHKRPPISLYPLGFLRGYVELIELPLLIARVSGWSSTSMIGNEFIRVASLLLEGKEVHNAYGKSR